MATPDNVRSYSDAAEITDFYLEKIAPRYFNMDNVNTYRAGTLGMILDAMSTTAEDTIHGMMIARREFYPNTAQYMKSLYRHASARFMDAPMAVPAQADVLLLIQQAELLKYGTWEGDLHTFILDDTFIAHVGDISFMLDYPVTILSVQKANGKYAHTTHYDFYIKNTLSISNDRYLPNKVMNYQGTEYVIVQARMRQVSKTYGSQLVHVNSAISTVTMDFRYDGMLANFEVFYTQDDRSPRIQLEKKMTDSGFSKHPFCWYTLVDDTTIRLMFPANAYFMPRMNSEVSIEIYTTDGEGGNFDTYDSDIISENASTRYPYNAQVPVFGTVDGASKGGQDLVQKEDFRLDVMRAYCTNHTYISVHDIQLYFDQLMRGTTDRFKFTPKRDDAFVRLYGAFLLMKDQNNDVIPTNTLDIDLDPVREIGDFDIYSDAVKRFIIKPGALFRYRYVSDATNRARFRLERIHGKNIYDDISDYDSLEGHWRCVKCGYVYDGEKPFKEIMADRTFQFRCPECHSSKYLFVSDNFIFTNPYLVSVSTDSYKLGYFMNSLEDHYDLAYTAVNDHSIVQFIARHFKIDRNAIAGENFYRFSVAISPSVDLNMDSIYEESDEVIRAPYNGKVINIRHNDRYVEATIIYTDNPESHDEIPEEERIQNIQVSSYMEKVDSTFYICPQCGHRMPVEEWLSAQEANFLNDDGTPMRCAHCIDNIPEEERYEGFEGPLVESFTEKYIDYEYYPGFKMHFNIGDTITIHDVIATRRPKDLGRIRLMMDINNIMSSAAHRYVPLTLEECSTDGANYMIYAAYLTTTDMIDSKHIMSIDTGFAMQNGDSGENRSLSIPIAGLTMKLHAFYQYKEDDELDAMVKNPAHGYSNYHYVSQHTFTNTYELQNGDSITLMRAMDNAKGFLDVVERYEGEWVDPGFEEDPDPWDPGGPNTDPNHPDEEWTERPQDDPIYTHYLRSRNHALFHVEDETDDRIDGRYLTVDKSDEWLKEEGITPKPKPSEPIDPDAPIPPEDPYDVPVTPDPYPEYPDDMYGSNFIFRARNCPVVSANWIKQVANEELFVQRITQHYENIVDILIALENAFTIDMKFYNTYGKSIFYKVGNGSATNLIPLDSVNITIYFGIALNFPASADVFRDNFREFVRKYIEATDDMIGNGIDLYLMNLVAAAKAQFDEIVYMEYYGINDYDYSAQRLTIMSDEEILKTVKADSFVPEFLNIVREDTTDGRKPRVKVTLIEGEFGR